LYRREKFIQKYKKHTPKSIKGCYPGQTNQRQLEREAKAKTEAKVKITYCQDK
jgi:hypothetical protein